MTDLYTPPVHAFSIRGVTFRVGDRVEYEAPGPDTKENRIRWEALRKAVIDADDDRERTARIKEQDARQREDRARRDALYEAKNHTRALREINRKK